MPTALRVRGGGALGALLVLAACACCAGSWQGRVGTALRGQKRAVDALDAAVATWYRAENERAIAKARTVEGPAERAQVYTAEMERAERVYARWHEQVLPVVQAAQRVAYEAYLGGEEGSGWAAARAGLLQALEEAAALLQEGGVDLPSEHALVLEALRGA